MKPKCVALLGAVAVLSLAPAGALGAESVPPPVPGFPIGRCVKVLGVTTPEEAKKIGFEYLELGLQELLPLSDEEFAKTVARFRGIGLPALSGYGFLPADLAIIGPEVDSARVDRELRHSLDRAQQLGIKLVVHGNYLGATRRIPAGYTREKAYAQFVDFARRAAVEAEKRGITVLIEPMTPKSADLINTVAEGLEFVEKVGHPNLQMLVEYSIMVNGHEDLRVLHQAASHIRQIEIQNPNGWVYPAVADESDYASFFRALKEGGYRGGFSIHGKPGDVFVSAPKAIALLRTFASGLAPISRAEKK